MEFTVVNAALVSLVEAALAPYIFPHTFSQAPLTSFLVVFLFLNSSIFTLYKLLLYPFVLSPLRHLPQARGFIPLVGHGYVMFQRPPGESYLRIMKATGNEGVILMRGFFHSDRLIVTSPAALADVLVHKSYDFEKPPWSRAFLKKFLGDGLLMTEGEVSTHRY
jgi:hypothetical protein